MDLALLTGQRAADVLKIKRSDIRDGALWVVQNKTGMRLGIEISGELAAVIARISERPTQAAPDTGDLAHSQKLLTHKNRPMTEPYVRARIGERIKPLR